MDGGALAELNALSSVWLKWEARRSETANSEYAYIRVRKGGWGKTACWIELVIFSHPQRDCCPGVVPEIHRNMQ
jgi:hypothetical protein